MNNRDNHILKELLADRADTRSRLLELEYVILKDTMDPQNRDAPRLTQLERADIERQITRCQNLIRTSTTSLLAIDPNIDAPKKSEVQDPDRRRQMSLRLALQVAASCRKFKKSETADRFWQYFQQTCLTNSLKDHECMMLLSSLLQDHPDGPTWYKNNVLPIQDTINLAEAKESFYSYFLNENWLADRHMEMASIIFRRTETVKEFTARFCKIVQENELDWNDPDPDVSYPKHLCSLAVLHL